MTINGIMLSITQIMIDFHTLYDLLFKNASIAEPFWFTFPAVLIGDDL